MDAYLKNSCGQCCSLKRNQKAYAIDKEYNMLESIHHSFNLETEGI